ncbi:MAG TPA: peptidoglycan-binding protein [Thermoanaerobaculia bacterium]|nr:peptidoglycan-binding protein [Thermoanaerobaculia bacterium]
MPRLLFGPGARGESVRLLQQKLTAAGFDTHGVDGGYGGGTTNAVKAFQERHGLNVSGNVDDSTWTAITGQPMPSLRDRCLALTSTFEGHGFTLAQGNFDGAGVTWGIIGFTLKGGELASIIRSAHASDATIVETCFGTGADTLLQVCGQPWDEQLAWSNTVSSGAQKETLAEPFKSGFARLGESPLGQQLQQQRVDEDYYKPALATAQKYGLKTELGIALCFDLHVQNGGISAAAGAAVRVQMRAGMAERDVRIAIANAVADRSIAAWREDVRKRKLTVATGEGDVHGTHYVLKNWGLDEVQVR